MSRTTPGNVARDAIAALEHRLAHAEATAVEALRRLDECERRMYGATATTITSYMEVERRMDFAYDAQLIRLAPKTAQFVLQRGELFHAKQSLNIIDLHIESVLKMHTDDLREQLRKAVWPRR